MKRLSKSFALVEMDSYESKQKLLRPDTRVFGIYVGGNMASVEDADMKLTITLSGIPYGTQLKTIFHFIQEKLDPMGIKLTMPEEEGLVVNSFLLIRLNSLQEAIKVMAALSAEAFGYSTLLSTFYFGNLRVHDGKYYESVDLHDRTFGEHKLFQSIDIMKDFEKSKIGDQHRKQKTEPFVSQREKPRYRREANGVSSFQQDHFLPDDQPERVFADAQDTEPMIDEIAEEENKKLQVDNMPEKFDFSIDDEEKSAHGVGAPKKVSPKIEIYDFELDSEDETGPSEETKIEHLDEEKTNKIDSMLSDLDKKLKK